VKLFVVLAWASAISACSLQPPPKVDDLHFPVVALQSGAIVYDNAADLQIMHVNRVTLAPPEPPVLIDSQFQLYTLEHLRSTHNGLWLMAHPSGLTAVAFDLKRGARSGLEAARDAILRQLNAETWRTDISERSREILKQETLLGMVEVLHRTSGKP
jgi:hypothetical protein